MDEDILRQHRDELINKWVAAISPVEGFGAPTARIHITALTDMMLDLLGAESLDREEAQRVGRALAKLTSSNENSLRKSIDVLSQISLKCIPEKDLSNLFALLSELNIGFHYFLNQKALEDAKEVLKEGEIRLSFVAAMAHEIRAGMECCINQPGLELRDELIKRGDESLLVYVEKLERGVQKMRDLLNDIVDLSKASTGKIELIPETVNIIEIIDSLSITVKKLAAQRNNSVQIQYYEFPGTMYVDSNRLRQILLNLLSNACKFTENGTILLSINRRQDRDIEKIVFTVRDTGAGIALGKLVGLLDWPEKHLRGLGPLRELPPAGGMGLGLKICKRLCDLMEGDISVDSEVSKGTVVTVVLPVHFSGKTE